MLEPELLISFSLSFSPLLICSFLSPLLPYPFIPNPHHVLIRWVRDQHTNFHAKCAIP